MLKPITFHRKDCLEIILLTLHREDCLDMIMLYVFSSFDLDDTGVGLCSDADVVAGGNNDLVLPLVFMFGILGT